MLHKPLCYLHIPPMRPVDDTLEIHLVDSVAWWQSELYNLSIVATNCVNDNYTVISVNSNLICLD